MAETEFKIGTGTYRAAPMGVFPQFHLARKIAPLMLPLATALGEKLDFKSLGAMEQDQVLTFAGPIIDALGQMTDAEADEIIFPCLSVVQRQQGPGWQPVLAAGAKTLMFDDITIQVMLQLVWKVLEANLSGFFLDVPSTSTEAPA